MDSSVDNALTIADVLAWLRDDLPPDRIELVLADVRSPHSQIAQLLRDAELLRERLHEKEPEAFAQIERDKAQAGRTGDLATSLETHPQPTWSKQSEGKQQVFIAREDLFQARVARDAKKELIGDSIRRREAELNNQAAGGDLPNL
jgi:hypothetical protein